MRDEEIWPAFSSVRRHIWIKQCSLSNKIIKSHRDHHHPSRSPPLGDCFAPKRTKHYSSELHPSCGKHLGSFSLQSSLLFTLMKEREAKNMTCMGTVVDFDFRILFCAGHRNGSLQADSLWPELFCTKLAAPPGHSCSLSLVLYVLQGGTVDCATGSLMLHWAAVHVSASW